MRCCGRLQVGSRGGTSHSVSCLLLSFTHLLFEGVEEPAGLEMLLAILGEEGGGGGGGGEAGRDPGIGTALFPFLPLSQFISRGYFVVVSTAWQEGEEFETLTSKRHT